MSIWVVCADSTRARIFSAGSPRGKLSEVRDLTHPESRLRPGDMVSDRGGSQANSGHHSQHGVGGEHDAPHREEADRFAREVAGELGRAAHGGDYERLHVVAAPAFLGMLRKHLTDETRARLGEEVTANVVTMDLQTIRAHLPESL